MIARVVSKREESRLALAVTALAAAGLAAIVADDLLRTRALTPPDFGVYAFVALLIAIGGVGPWLSWRNDGVIEKVRLEPGWVRVGSVVIEGAGVTALGIAGGARGHSVAIRRGRDLLFLEVERRDEALRIARALSPSSPSFGELRLTPVKHVLAVVQALVTSIAIACAPLYLTAASQIFETPGLADSKAIFGMGGVIASVLALAILVLRRVLPDHAQTVGVTTWDRHVALHLAGADPTSTAGGEAAEAESERALDEAARAAYAPRLARGDEQVGAWLARLDSLPTVTEVYRGGALEQDELWTMLGDVAAPVDARMGAARMLRVRYGEPRNSIVRVVDDPDVRVRVSAALEEEVEDAEQHLARLGPLFRAR